MKNLCKAFVISAIIVAAPCAHAEGVTTSDSSSNLSAQAAQQPLATASKVASAPTATGEKQQKGKKGLLGLVSLLFVSIL